MLNSLVSVTPRSRIFSFSLSASYSTAAFLPAGRIIACVHGSVNTGFNEQGGKFVPGTPRRFYIYGGKCGFALVVGEKKEKKCCR
jgi:hypothetical protein